MVAVLTQDDSSNLLTSSPGQLMGSAWIMPVRGDPRDNDPLRYAGYETRLGFLQAPNATEGGESEIWLLKAAERYDLVERRAMQ